VNESLLAHLATRAMAMAPWPDPRFPPSPYYRFFKLLTEAMHPNLSVELGVCGGGASFHMALGWSGGTVVGVEHSEGDAQQRANWAYMKERCPNFVLWRGDSVDDAPKIAETYGEVSVLFVDTVHLYDRTIEEWNAWERYMAEDAVICLDDLNRREMEGFWAWIPWRKARFDFLHDGGLDADGFGDGGFGACWRS